MFIFKLCWWKSCNAHSLSYTVAKQYWCFLWSNIVFWINFSSVGGLHDSLVVSQYVSCFIIFRSTCMHWPLIIGNDFPLCLSSCAILSQYVLHLLSCSTLASTSRTMGSIWWLFYSDSTISILRIAKDILYLAAMTGSPCMTCSS